MATCADTEALASPHKLPTVSVTVVKALAALLNTLAVANSWTCSQSSGLGNLQDYFCPQWSSHLQPRHLVLEIERLGPKLICISNPAFVRLEKNQMWTPTTGASTALETYFQELL